LAGVRARTALAVAVLVGWPSVAGADWLCTPTEQWRQPITRLFSLFDDSYFITGIPSDPKTSNSQIKFQFSFKFDLAPNEGPCGLFFAYTQRTLWNAYAASAPFEDTNYNPQLFFVFGLKDIASLRVLPPPGKPSFMWVRFGLEHESNGQGGDTSRSWNRIFASARFYVLWGSTSAIYLTLQPKVWVPFVSSDNPDLVSYVGYGELITQLGWHDLLDHGRWQDLELGLLLRKGTADWKGTVQLSLSYRPPWRYTSFSFYAQAFFGYDETLLHYNERTSEFRVGIAVDDRFSWTTGEPGAVPRPPPPVP
jgi:phospholipase A1/A2